MCFVDNDAICADSGEERETIGGLSPAGIVVEGNVGKTVSGN